MMLEKRGMKEKKGKEGKWSCELGNTTTTADTGKTRLMCCGHVVMVLPIFKTGNSTKMRKSDKVREVIKSY